MQHNHAPLSHAPAAALRRLAHKTLRAALAATLIAAVATPIASPIALFAPSVALAEDTGYNADTPPELQAQSAYLKDRTTGTVLLNINSGDRRYPASTTKVMTALLVLENAKLDDTVTIAEEDFAALDENSMTAGLEVGETLTVQDMLACLLLPSANECAYALARHVSGSVDSFVELMNARAKELGCKNTNFVNPCGLHDDNHYTTAYDLSLIFDAALQLPDFVEIAGSTTWELPATNMQEARTIESTDELTNANGPVYVEGVQAAKTGYTEAAGRCLVAAAAQGDMNLMGVVLGAPNTDSGSGVTANFVDMYTMFMWGFEAWQSGAVISEGADLGTAPVAQSSDGDEVGLVALEAFNATVPIDTKTSDLTITPTWKEELTAPISATQELGTVTVSLDGQELGTVKVGAATTMRASLFAKIGAFLSSPFNIIISILVIALAGILAYVGFSVVRARRHQVFGGRGSRRYRQPASRSRQDRGRGPAHSRVAQGGRPIPDARAGAVRHLDPAGPGGRGATARGPEPRGAAPRGGYTERAPYGDRTPYGDQPQPGNRAVRGDAGRYGATRYQSAQQRGGYASADRYGSADNRGDQGSYAPGRGAYGPRERSVYPAGYDPDSQPGSSVAETHGFSVRSQQTNGIRRTDGTVRLARSGGGSRPGVQPSSYRGAGAEPDQDDGQQPSYYHTNRSRRGGSDTGVGMPHPRGRNDW